ncbi:hypothetical protein [Hydrogenophaga sp.]|uniref:hypothetical protein n=1 Tax=Hydrogenophaga sp. TaxID=1904254 RepID=UPI00271BE21E|nr:hypothetical protein [Hydrogenophaga sp.]MDO8903830.1 hypothetical protein [Hydrogenophaga sp.]
MLTPSLSTGVRALEHGDMEACATSMLDPARKLAAVSADYLIRPDKTIQQAFEQVAPRLPLPWLHIAEVVAEESPSRRFQWLGISGTRWLVESDVYPRKLEAHGLRRLHPPGADRIRMGQTRQSHL